MNNIKSFSFYRNYYEIIKYLPNEERIKLYDAVMEYVFEDKNPELEKLLKGIWINLKMCLDTSKNNSIRSIGKGAPLGNQNASKKQTKNKPKTNQKGNQKQTNNISYFLFLISNNKYKYINKDSSIYNKITEWLEYKEERKEKYTEIGLKSLLTQLEKQIDIHGEKSIVNLIEECMSNNYKGIIFDRLKNKKIEANTPEWMDKDINSSISENEKEEMNNILKELGE